MRVFIDVSVCVCERLHLYCVLQKNNMQYKMFGKNLFIGKIFYRFTITIIISHHNNLEGPISNFAPGPEISGPALPFIRSCCIVRADAYLMMLLPCVPICTLTSVHFCISTFATKTCVCG